MYSLEKNEIYKCIYFLLKSLTKYEGWSFTEKIDSQKLEKIKNQIVFTPTPITLFYWIPTDHTFYCGGQYTPKNVYWSHFVFQNKKKTNINLLPTYNTWPVYFCKVHLTENLSKSPCISKTIFLFFTYLF